MLKKLFLLNLFDYSTYETDKKNLNIRLVSKRLLDVNEYKEVSQWINYLGWFVSVIKVDVPHLKIEAESLQYSEQHILNLFNTYNSLKIEFLLERKFDETVDPIPKKLYHITIPEQLKEIKKIGLTPKTKQKLSHHPDRIYFGFKEQEVIDLVKAFHHLDPSENVYTVLEINTSFVPAYLRLFIDPDYIKCGCYTLNNIPPIAIQETSTIIIS